MLLGKLVKGRCADITGNIVTFDGEIKCDPKKNNKTRRKPQNWLWPTRLAAN